MIAYIHSATIAVSDQEAALDFYVNKLGWEKRIDYPMGDGYRFVTVAPPGGQAELALQPAETLRIAPGEGIAREGSGMDGHIGISLAVENFDETYRTLVERGVRFTGEPEDMPWGDKAAWMVDPDGNTFFFVGK
ncbi:MAG TPA: VOC family protein [Longimicrobium sp.]|nr:VOC family protein [Longimicrobium sp.]